MVIWINGAFGAGKTQTAHELQRRIPNSYLYDPENVGFFIRSNIPAEIKKADFQDDPLWREFNYSMLKNMTDQYKGTVIVPMTIVNAQYFDEIIGRLRQDGVEVHHFALCATKDVLLKRLRSRGEGKNSWAAQQIERCIEGLSQPCFEQHIDTNQLMIEDVVTQIAARLKVDLLPDNRSRMQKKFDRMKTQLKHIRFPELFIYLSRKFKSMKKAQKS